MLSDGYNDAASFLTDERDYYFGNPQDQAYKYSEKHKARLNLYIEILSVEADLFDCLGIEGVSSLKEHQQQQMERYNSLLNRLKLRDTELPI